MDHHQKVESRSNSGSSCCFHYQSSSSEQFGTDSNYGRRAKQQRHDTSRHIVQPKGVVVPRQQKRIVCIFELPYDWDLRNLPPTVHGGSGDIQQKGVRRYYYPLGEEQSITHNKMWCKAHITTSCDMDDDDLSSLGSDIEEYDIYDGEDEEEEEEGPLSSSTDNDDKDFCMFDKKHPDKTTKTKQTSVPLMWRKLAYGRSTPRRGRVGTVAAVPLDKSNQGSNRDVRGRDSPSPSSLSMIFDIITLSTFSMSTAGNGRRSTRSNKRVEYDEVSHRGEDSTDRVEDDSLSVETCTPYRWTNPSTQGRPQLTVKKEQQTINMTKPRRRRFGRWRIGRRGRRSSTPCD